MAKEKIDLSVIIVSFNTLKLTKNCIKSVYKYTNKLNFEIITIDNNSTDGSIDYLSKLATQKNNFKLVKNSENKGFAAANNQGIVKSRGRYLLFLNPDTLFTNDFLKSMINWMDKNAKVGITSCALKNKDGSFQKSGGFFPSLLRVAWWQLFIDDIPLLNKTIKSFHPPTAYFAQEHEQDWVTGAFLLIRTNVLKQVGKFDEKYFMYTEETDLCFRATKKNWQVWYLPKWSIIHLGGASSTSEFAILSEYKGVKRFFKKHYPKWQYPFFKALMKTGALARLIIFGILEGPSSAKTYAKALKQV